MMNRKKLFFVGAIGNAVEIFEALLYAFFQTYITATFFPPGFRENNLLFMITIILPFLARPLGAIYFGMMGDLKGRKVVLEISMILSGVSCGLITILPSYQDIGILSFYGVVVLRFLLGFALSGEYNNAFLYLAEHAEPRSRGYIVSWAYLGVSIGILAATLSSFSMIELIDNSILPPWSFRLLFLISAISIYMGFKTRRSLAETADFFISFPLREVNKPKAVLKTAKNEITKNAKNVFKIILLLGFGSHISYSLVLYAPFYLLESNPNISSNKQSISLIIFYSILCSMLIPIIGKLSDIMGRKFFLISSIVASTTLYLLFFFKLATTATYTELLFFYLFVAIADALYTTSEIEALELLPSSMRSTVNGILCAIPTIILGALSLPYFEILLSKFPYSPMISLVIALPLLALIITSKDKLFGPTYHYRYELEKTKIK